jgi:tetratricopeptide (TPR) repeat protein
MRAGVGSSTGAFVGREHDLRELEIVLDEGAAGRGRVVLISGEAGIGKTRLSEEAGHLAVDRGFRLLRASCFLDEGAPPFWLWIQILRGLVAKAGPDVEALLGSRRAEVARLVPELARPGDPEFVMDAGARFRLLDALAGSLRAFAERQPLVVVLDDLHWADGASLQMLRHCAREVRDAPIVVIGAYRDTELRGPLGDVITDLRRVTDGIALTGLTPEDIGLLIAPWTSDTPRLVRVVTQETGGNPFFVKEVVRLLAAQGRLDEDIDLSSLPVLPQTVRDVIDHHLARLSQPCHDALELAAVLGHEFAIAILSEVSDVPPDRLLDLIGEAVSARVLAEVPDVPATFRFSHALVREAVYEGLGPVRSRRLHQRIGDALERAYRGRDEHAATLAHHFLRAAPLTPSEKAVSYSSRAGELAARSVAYEQAARHFEDALRALDLGVADPMRRCEVLLALGDARWRSGDVDAARVTFRSAADAARAAGAGELLAQAALGYGAGVGGQGFTFAADETLIGLLEDALRSVDDSNVELHARLIARLAVQYYWSGELDRGKALSTRAITLAETTGDPRILLEALYSRLAETDIPLDEEIVRAHALVATAAGGRDLELLFWAQQYRLTILAELGDVAGVDDGIDACARIADELRMPRYRWQVTSWRLGRALMAADLELAQRLCDESIALTPHFESDSALFVHAAQLSVLRWEQGRFDELEPMIAALAEQYPWITATRATLALMYADAGRDDEARAVYERLSAGGFAEVRRNPARVASVWSLALPCFIGRDAERAHVLFKELEPYVDRDIVMGGMIFAFGSTKVPLGLLAAATGDDGRAVALLRDAVERNAATGNECMRVFALRELGAVQLVSDPMAARACLTEALDRIGTLGLHGLEPRARRLLAELGDDGTVVPAGIALTRQGDSWSLAFGGKQVVVRDVKGLRDIAALVAAPGRELHVAELVAATEGVDPSAVATVLNRPTEDILDDEARSAYRERIVDLQQELDDARNDGDLVRAERARAELDVLTEQLQAALGLGDRSRVSTNDAERARKAVGWRIRDAIKRIEAVHPGLAAHLRASLQLGAFCSYRP